MKFMYGDKLGHISSYLILMFWFGNIYYGKRQRLWLGITFITMGVLLEILQGVGGYREFQFADMLANSVGVALGWSLARTRLSNCLLFIDAWFFRC